MAIKFLTHTYKTCQKCSKKTINCDENLIWKDKKRINKNRCDIRHKVVLIVYSTVNFDNKAVIKEN